jgi:hypothetical protein
MGEPLGDGATRMEVGGKIIYGGGGGSPPPQPTTTITESGPSVSSINRTTVNEIPDYLTGASQDLVARGQALTSRPYEAYTGARVSEFSPLMNQAFGRMGGQQVAGQLGQASGLAGLAGQRASDYGMFQEGVQQYMNPYMQNVVDVERRKAQEAADRQSAQLSGQAAKQGAFGGSGAALQQRALTRDTAQQLADIQTQGSGRAYEQAVGQYNQGISSMLGAAGQLGGLGQQQFAQEMDITKGLGTAGDVQRQREQALLDVGYGDYLAEQKYPYEQLAFQQGLVAGVPYSTTQRVSGSEVTQPGKTVSQQVTANPSEMAAGGEVKSYAAGGIASLNQPQMASAASGMSDQQLQQSQGLPSITQLAQMTLQAEAQQRAQMRQVAQAQMAQRPQGTVADDERARIAAMEQGIGGLDVPDDLVGDEYTAAGGGIVAFSNGGKASWEEDLEALQAPPQESSSIGRAITGFFTRSDDVEALRKRAMVKQAQGLPLNAMEAKVLQSQAPAAPAQPTGIASLTDGSDSRFTRKGGPAVGGITDQAPAKATPKPGEETKPKAEGTAGGPARSSTKFLDDAYGQQEKLLREASKKDTDAQREYMKDLEKDGKEAGDFASKARQKIEQRMAGLEGADRSALESSVLDFGLRLLATKGEKNMAKALASAGLNTIAGHKQALKEIAAKRDKYDDALAKVDEFEYGERKGTAKERRAALLGLGKAEAALSKDLAGLVGDQTKDLFQLYRDDRAHNRAVQLAGMRASGSGTGVSKAVKDAEAAFARDPQALAIKKQLENVIVASNPAKRETAENKLRMIRADKYRQFGATLETDTAGATGSDSDPLGIL